MSKTRFVSGKEILARLIRATGKRLPSEYHDDILEWVAEGLGMLQVTNTLLLTSTGDIDCPDEIEIRNHCAELPCGFQFMEAVEDENGLRLPEGSDKTDYTRPTTLRHRNIVDARVSAFNVNPYQHQTSDGLPTDEPSASFPFLGEDIEPTTEVRQTKHYYNLSGNHIHTSFEEGFVKLHYWTTPVCKEGFPMIPDNENFKQAMEFHVLRRLLGAGYEHPVFTYDYVDKQFELYAVRGMNEVSYPSPETMARINRSTVRLIPNYAAYQDFFIGSEQAERLSK
jgi:hypothetical protein